MIDKGEAETVRLWLFIEDRLAEDEAARIEALSDEALAAEMRAAGFDPDAIATFDEVMTTARAGEAGARGAARVRGARAGEGDVGPEGAALYDGAGIVRAIPASAVSSSSMETARLPSSRRRAGTETVRPPEMRANNRIVWLLAACFLLVLGAVGYAERGAIVARLHRTPVDIGPAPVPTRTPPPVEQPVPALSSQPVPPMPNQDEWARDRESAQQACDGHDWAKCEHWLLMANRADPAATVRDERIQRMWIEVRKHIPPENPKTGRPEP